MTKSTVTTTSGLTLGAANVAEWVGLHYGRNLDAESSGKKRDWADRFAKAHGLTDSASQANELSRVVTVQAGMAALEHGVTVDLLKIQALLNAAFQETGDHEFMDACDELSKVTGKHQGPHGEFVDGPY